MAQLLDPPDVITSTPCYIYDDVEVVLTGREATRTNTEKTRRSVNKTETKVEITPADKLSGTWKKWVMMKDLFIITKTNGQSQ